MKTRRRASGGAGFTLIEIVVASLPLAIVALTLFTAFGFTVRFSRRGEAGIEAVGQARLALHLLANELREASAAPGAIVIGSADDGTDGARQDGIGFLSARADGPGRPFFTDTHGLPRWQHAVYYLHDPVRGEVRRLSVEATTLEWPPPWAEGRIVARQITRLRLERQGDVVIIGLTVRKSVGEAVLDIAVRPRN